MTHEMENELMTVKDEVLKVLEKKSGKPLTLHEIGKSTKELKLRSNNTIYQDLRRLHDEGVIDVIRHRPPKPFQYVYEPAAETEDVEEVSNNGNGHHERKELVFRGSVDVDTSDFLSWLAREKGGEEVLSLVEEFTGLEIPEDAEYGFTFDKHEDSLEVSWSLKL